MALGICMAIYIPIWFDLNKICSSCKKEKPYLHSNMVRFKLKNAIGSDMRIPFTFQYGSI